MNAGRKKWRVHDLLLRRKFLQMWEKTLASEEVRRNNRTDLPGAPAFA
jgi:hypothetical protein